MLALWLPGVSLAPQARAQDAPADASPAIAAIRFYQRYLSSLRHARCRFTPSCSEYAAQAIATYGLVEGSARAADRLTRCNASAAGAYPRGAQGVLEDPVDAAGTGVTSVRVPRWLLSPPEAGDAPIAGAVAPERRARLAETIRFARLLERRGDCERAETEYQRAGSLADTVAADAWAFARIGACRYAASQWPLAERAYLTSAMLAEGDRRASVAYAAAASRFNAGAFAACGRLLEDPVFAAPRTPAAHAAPGDPRVIAAAAEPSGPPVPRVETLAGLCAFAEGDWPRAEGRFARAAAEGGDDGLAARDLRLAAFAREGPALPHRSPGLAGVLSAALPGTGQMYCGRAQDGWRHLLFNGVLLYSVVSLARGPNVPAAVVVAGVTLPFYAGNILGAQAAARGFDRQQRLDLLERALAEASR
ncbi:MAG: hypothetical protein A2W00_05185 [Candidatus Eisenbacteria bacterium RBG_16_71_46]|nr:MAG: hypothetical protein A2W00_05185 [Candidatus Eisenbacteria bacterium RBG_16_71_46]